MALVSPSSGDIWRDSRQYGWRLTQLLEKRVHGVRSPLTEEACVRKRAIAYALPGTDKERKSSVTHKKEQLANPFTRRTPVHRRRLCNSASRRLSALLFNRQCCHLLSWRTGVHSRGLLFG